MATKPKLYPGAERLAAERVRVDTVTSEIEAQLAVIARRRATLADGEMDAEMSAAAASLGKVLLAGSAERRQQQKTAAREVAAIPLDELIEHLRSLPLGARMDIARQLTGADDLEPLL